MKTFKTKVRYKFIGIAVAVAVMTGACAPNRASDHAKIESAIGTLSRGDVFREMERDSQRAVQEFESTQSFSEAWLAGERPTAWGEFEAVGESDATAYLKLADPCPKAVDRGEHADKKAVESSLNDLAACMFAFTRNTHLHRMVARYFRRFRAPNGVDLASLQYKPLDLLRVARGLDSRSGLTHSMDATKRDLLRGEFVSGDITDLLLIKSGMTQAYRDAQTKVFAALHAKPKLLKHVAHLKQWQGLLILKDTVADRSGQNAFLRLVDLFKTEIAGRKVSRGIAPLLHPYAFQGLLPFPGGATRAMNFRFTNPFAYAAAQMYRLGGPSTRSSRAMKLYRASREKDRLALTPHPAAAKGAARVAFVDSGIDVHAYPELGLFLGQGRKGELRSYDYADSDGTDSNPWLPAIGALAHGSQTVGTFLTVLSHYKPEVLRQRKLDLAMWKVRTARSVLAGAPFYAGGIWESRTHSVFDGLVHQIYNKDVKPQILGMSLVFRSAWLATAVKDPLLFKKAPWLWLMSAGNNGKDTAKFKDACLLDLQPEHRPTERIICVGAIKRTPAGKLIAQHSNYGAGVDLYSFETYNNPDAPEGTSFSQPAVAALGAMALAEYPQLTPEELKKILVGAATEEELAFEQVRSIEDELLGKPHAPERKLKVRVLDPASRETQKRTMAAAAAVLKAR